MGQTEKDRMRKYFIECCLRYVDRVRQTVYVSGLR